VLLFFKSGLGMDHRHLKIID